MTANLSDLYRRRRAGVHGTSPQHVGGRGSAPGGSHPRTQAMKQPSS